jgi:hypothetical protein
MRLDPHGCIGLIGSQAIEEEEVAEGDAKMEDAAAGGGGWQEGMGGGGMQPQRMADCVSEVNSTCGSRRFTG